MERAIRNKADILAPGPVQKEKKLLHLRCMRRKRTELPELLIIFALDNSFSYVLIDHFTEQLPDLGMF